MAPEQKRFIFDGLQARLTPQYCSIPTCLEIHFIPDLYEINSAHETRQMRPAQAKWRKAACLDGQFPRVRQGWLNKSFLC